MNRDSIEIADEMLAGPAFGDWQGGKYSRLLAGLENLTRHHYDRCGPYRRVVDAVFGGLRSSYNTIEEIPFIPVSLFKQFELSSIAPGDVFRTMTSSGTTGQSVSRVFLDRETAGRQGRALVRIMQHFIGKDRLPMVILDHPGVLNKRDSFSARGAGILGLMQFGRRPIYALSNDMSFDADGVHDYLREHSGQPVLFFGFTFMVWQYAILSMMARGLRLQHNQGVLIHSGGWKKLEAARVDAEAFGAEARNWLGVERVINFYGMVEQVGSVFFENQLGQLHTPVFAEVIVRDPHTLRPLPAGRRGILQVLSILPKSYPGHSLLTEDLGSWTGLDETAAGMPGRFFNVVGRAPQSEVRGCSDTYAQTT